MIMTFLARREASDMAICQLITTNPVIGASAYPCRHQWNRLVHAIKGHVND